MTFDIQNSSFRASLNSAPECSRFSLTPCPPRTRSRAPRIPPASLITCPPAPAPECSPASPVPSAPPGRPLLPAPCLPTVRPVRVRPGRSRPECSRSPAMPPRALPWPFTCRSECIPPAPCHASRPANFPTFASFPHLPITLQFRHTYTHSHAMWERARRDCTPAPSRFRRSHALSLQIPTSGTTL